MKKFLLLIFFAAFALLSAADTGVICSPDGVCYLPGMAPAENTSVTAADFILQRKAVGMMDVPQFLAFLEQESVNPVNAYSFAGMLLLALIGGFLLNLTPCVLPMIPVNLAIIGAKGGKNGFRRGALYGCGMAAAYGVLGLLAAFAGVSFGGMNSSPVFNIIIGLLFLFMALAMVGVVNLDFRRFFPDLSGKMRNSTPFLLGAVAALLAGACVAPVVASVLVYTAGAVNGGKYYAVILPFVLGAGMALPWPFAGAGMSILPKPGRFMEGIKYILGAVIFLAAVYYIMLGIRLTRPLPPETQNGFAALAEARNTALQKKLPILVEFTASWCKNCRAMKNTTLADPAVKKAVAKNFIPVTFPAEDPSQPEISALLKAWGIPGFPAFVIISPQK